MKSIPSKNNSATFPNPLLLVFVVGVAFGFLLARSSINRGPAGAPVSPPPPPDAPATACAHDERRFNCVRYLGNYDGDTIKVEIPGVHPLLGHSVSVRLYGIDTAEMKGKHPCERSRAQEARQLVAQTLTGSKRIDLRNVRRDKYFRVLADVFADDRSVSELLVEKNLAYRYGGGTKERVDWCRRG